MAATLHVNGGGELILVASFAIGAIAVAAHVIMTIAVYNDIGRRAQRRLPIAMMGLWSWSIVTLALGVVAFTLYWAMHYSVLRGDRDGEGTPEGWVS